MEDLEVGNPHMFTEEGSYVGLYTLEDRYIGFNTF